MEPQIQKVWIHADRLVIDVEDIGLQAELFPYPHRAGTFGSTTISGINDKIVTDLRDRLTALLEERSKAEDN